MKRLILRGTVLLTLGLLFGSAARADFLYWAADGNIQRANLDTMEVEADLLPGVEFIQSFDVDPIRGKIYWTLSLEDKIQRANLDGSHIEDVATGFAGLRPITVDAASGKLYWGDREDGHGGIRRANLDGSMMEDVTRLISPRSIAIDSDGGYAYTTAVGATGYAVYRVRLDGSGIEEITRDPTFLTGVALDVVGEKVYWADMVASDVPGKIQRANLDGSGIETIVDGFVATPIGVAVDSSSGKLYWSDTTWETIYRADLDGRNIEILFTGFDSGPGELRFVPGEIPEPSTGLMTLSAGFVLIATLAGRRFRRSARLAD
jgi:DNA-binding beta-propeller fold protein YncE